jgi:hypothetical protein
VVRIYRAIPGKRPTAEQVRDALRKLSEESPDLNVASAADLLAIHATDEDLDKLRRMIR